jgi:hypothetical protein
MAHPFEVGKTYRNRIGEYTVVSIDEEQMKIRYTDGKTLQTNVTTQARIWENIQFEERLSRAEERRKLAQEARLASRKQTREARVKVEFGGFQASDFQPKGRAIAWTSRQQLGRVLAYELRRRTKSAYGFWAVPRQPAVYLARKDRYVTEARDRTAALFVSAGEDGLSFGFYVGKPEGEAAPDWHWSVLGGALAGDEGLRRALPAAMAAHALSLDLYGMQLEYGPVGHITVREGADGPFQWLQESATEQISRPMDWTALLDQVQAVSAHSRSGLYLQAHLPPEACVQAGAGIVQQITAVFEALVPVYDASTRT